MADTISDADKIRNKRLAKLQSQAPGSSSEASASSTPPSPAPPPQRQSSEQTSQTPPKININATPSASTVVSPTDLSSNVPGSNLLEQSGTNIRITPAGPSKDITSAAGQPPIRIGSPRLHSRDSPELWEDRALSSIFKLTLREDVRQDAHGHALHFIPGTRAELSEQGAQPRLTTGVLDQAILEAASNLQEVSPLDYLLGCWKRVIRQARGLKSGPAHDAKLEILKEARRLCMSYCVFAVTMPDMFGVDAPSSNPLVPHLLVDPEDDRGICHDFLTEIVSRFDEDETAKESMVSAVEALSAKLSEMTMNDDFKPYVLALRNMVRYPKLVEAFSESQAFAASGVEAQEIEDKTLLGPFFRISPLQGEVTVNYFSSPKTRDKGYIINSQKALRMALHTHQQDLLDIVNQIIRASKDSRERILDWFAQVVNKNHMRRAIQVDNDTVSSDGFMINITVCLDQLCEPFMDSTFSKIDRIDVDYLRRNPRVDIREETKINADQRTSDEYYSTKLDGTPNFISEVFFLTLAAHHYGSEATMTKLEQLEKDLKHMEKQMEKFEAERSQWINTPRYTDYENAMKKYQTSIDRGLSYKYAVQGVLSDDLNQARSMLFMRYVIVWMLRMVSPAKYPSQPLKLPLPLEEPDVFKCLPEYFFEDVVSNFKFIFSHLPHVITSTQSDELVTLCITFLRSSEYVKNPYLKSGLVTILFRGIWPSQYRQRGALGDLLISLPFATEHLLHALMNFYIEAENTGGHNQFYDKFNMRYEIFQIIKCIWTNPMYRENLSTESKVNVDFFVRFVNLLLNDVTFVLDESLTAFGKIHDLQIALESPTLTDEAARTEKEEALADAESKAKSYMQLTNETVEMLKLFTEALADSFTMPEIVQRLADMLDYNLDAMVGTKSANLRVQNPEKYQFNPRELLSEIVDVYLNLRDKPAFIDAVARDGRSYKPANFEKATKVLSKWALKSGDALAAWTSLGEAFRRAKELDDQAEEDLGDVPDEFLDPLMYTLMEDPVILPASKASIDRATIRSHLLSDPSDPFNRMPLRMEDVKDDVELREKIRAWKAERMDLKRAKAEARHDEMDVSGG